MQFVKTGLFFQERNEGIGLQRDSNLLSLKNKAPSFHAERTSVPPVQTWPDAASPREEPQNWSRCYPTPGYGPPTQRPHLLHVCPHLNTGDSLLVTYHHLGAEPHPSAWFHRLPRPLSLPRPHLTPLPFPRGSPTGPRAVASALPTLPLPSPPQEMHSFPTPQSLAPPLQPIPTLSPSPTLPGNTYKTAANPSLALTMGLRGPEGYHCPLLLTLTTACGTRYGGPSSQISTWSTGRLIMFPGSHSQ